MSINKYINSITVTALLLSFVGCNRAQLSLPENNIVILDGKKLLRNEIEDAMPAGLSGTDSARFADKYVDTWIINKLLLDKANQNLSAVETNEIEKQVEKYKQALMINEYKKLLINDKLSKSISLEEQKAYFAQYGSSFLLNEAIIKGIFLKIPQKAKNLDKIRKWYKTDNAKVIEDIEKYSVHNAIQYENFLDKWVPFNEIIQQIPYPVSSSSNFLTQNKILDIETEGYIYLLRISQYKTAGSTEPFEFAQNKIIEILSLNKKRAFLQKIEDDLYKEAIEKNRIYFRKKQEE